MGHILELISNTTPPQILDRLLIFWLWVPFNVGEFAIVQTSQKGKMFYRNISLKQKKIDMQ